MKQVHNRLEELESLVDQLLDVAKEIEEISRKSPDEKKLTVLQDKQDDLVQQIDKFEKQVKVPKESSEKESLIEARILTKFQEFEKCNRSYIQNLRSKGGLLYFDRLKS